MASFQLTAKAKDDLRNIARYTQEKWVREQRNIYLKQFDDVFSLLSQTPEIGPTCDFIEADYRKFPRGSHVIFYKLSPLSMVQIVRILHKYMDVSLNLG